MGLLQLYEEMGLSGAVYRRGEQVLEQLEVRCIFGLYLRGLPGSPEQRQYAEDLFRRVSDCLVFLEAGDTDGFARRFGQLCREAWEGARERLTPEEN